MTRTKPKISREEGIGQDGSPIGIISHIVYNDMGLCGCTDPELFGVLNKALMWLDTPYEQRDWDPYYKQLTDICSTPAFRYAVFNLLDNGGLIEHGGNLIGSWLTPLGKEYIQEFAKLSDAEVEGI